MFKEVLVKGSTVASITSKRIESDIIIRLPIGLLRDEEAQRQAFAQQLICQLTNELQQEAVQTELTIAGQGATVTGNIKHESVGQRICLEITPDEGFSVTLATLNKKQEVLIQDLSQVDIKIQEHDRRIEKLEQLLSRARIAKGIMGANPPFFNNKKFVSRNDLIKELKKSLANSSDSFQVTLSAYQGLGGVGKTQLALYYFYNSNYKFYCWFQAETTRQLELAYQDLAKDIGLAEQGDSPDETCKKVIAWLNKQEGGLLVYDNAEEPSVLNPYLPRGGKNHVLITSRYTNWMNAICVELMTMKEAKQLIRNILQDKSGNIDPRVHEKYKNDLEALITELGSLPLALAQAASYIKQDPENMTLADYISEYRKKRALLLAEKIFPELEEYQLPAAYTWEMTLDVLQTKETGPSAVKLFRMLAYLGSEAIPHQLVRALVGDNQFRATINLLKNYSLINNNSKDKMLSIHRVLQACLLHSNDNKNRVSIEDKKQYLSILAETLSKYFVYDPRLPRDSVESLRVYFPHVITFIGQGVFDNEPSLNKLNLLVNLATYYSRELCYFDKALECLNQALAMLKHTTLLDIDKKIQESHIRFEMGHVYFSKQNFTEAENYYRQAVTLDEEIEAIDPTREQLNRAVILHQLANTIDRRNPTLDLDLLKSINYFYFKAFKINLKKLTKKQHTLGRDRGFIFNGQHTLLQAMGDNLHELANLQSITGHHEEALQLIEKALLLKRIFYQEDNHPDLAISLGMWGIILARAKDYDGAKQKFEETLAMYRKTYDQYQYHDEYKKTQTKLEVLLPLARKGEIVPTFKVVEAALSDYDVRQNIIMRLNFHIPTTWGKVKKISTRRMPLEKTSSRLTVSRPTYYPHYAKTAHVGYDHLVNITDVLVNRPGFAFYSSETAHVGSGFGRLRTNVTDDAFFDRPGFAFNSSGTAISSSFSLDQIENSDHENRRKNLESTVQFTRRVAKHPELYESQSSKTDNQTVSTNTQASSTLFNSAESSTRDTNEDDKSESKYVSDEESSDSENVRSFHN